MLEEEHGEYINYITMENFSMAFIFEGSQKELMIDGDGDVFYNAVFNLLTTFAENVDYSNNQIKFSLYKQNTDAFIGEVERLSNLYKTDVPRIQQLLAFFKQQPRDEWFYIDINHFPSQDELIKIGASLEYLNGGKPYEESMAEINSLFSGVNEKYNIYTFLGNTRKHFYGEQDRTKRICRYCHRSEKEGAKFTQEAHAISDTLGNKVLYSYDECDECNDYLGSHCEQDLGEFLRFQRCYYGVKGRDGVPVLRGLNFEMSHPEGQPLRIDYHHNGEDIPDDIKSLLLKYDMVFNPQNLYRALVKYFVGLVPSEYVSHFYNTGTWVKGVDNSGQPISIEKLPAIKRLSVPQPVDRPQLIIYIRKDDDRTLPYAIGEFHIFTDIFTYIIPLSDADDRDFCAEEDFNRFWDYFKHYKAMQNWTSINISIDEKTTTNVRINLSGEV